MEIKNKITDNPQKFLRLIGACIGVLIFVFEIIISVQYCVTDPLPAPWTIGVLTGCFVVLDVLCFVDLYALKTLTSRIVVYCFDFVFLLVICTITGSAYLSALYCVVLSLFYLNIEYLHTKIIVFVSSCVMFVVTCVVGWFLNHMSAASYQDIMDIVVSCLVGLAVIVIHFAVANFLLSFYHNNIKLKAAISESEERKAQLEEVYKQLSETAVFQERNRIARDMHDNAGHSMTAVIMQTEAAKLLIDKNPDEAKNKIIAANMQAKNALEQMRESVHLLAGKNAARPLKEELEEVIAQTMDGTGIVIRYNLADIPLEGDRRRFVVNSLKECLSNGIRHGGATAFYVEFSEESEVVRLTVSDNGSGLPVDFKEGFGLKGIREKAVSFGGSIIIESESGDGCEIKIDFRKE